MKRSSLIIALLALIVSFSACKKVPRSGKMKFANSVDSVSYALGYIEAGNFKKNFNQVPFEMDSTAYMHFAKAIAKTKLSERYTQFRNNQFNEINEEAFYKGFLNELAYGKSYFSEMSADIYLRKIFEKNKAVRDSIKKEKGKANLEKGRKFLEENKAREGVFETESGLQYEIIKEGNGPKPGARDRVKCVYHGTLLDGTVFDSAKERGDTTSFGVNAVIKGWKEALTLMPEGSEWRLYVPGDLAYGERGSRDIIGPNETLIFDVNLVEVIPNKK
ncbi:FKBP-type peptidyl-prolyl cis-trans isomerase [Marinifilum caeruleilacunae]|uniref:Peptidyl-prolyl cis-trans isomerase n=1 Tax=Marinifilum caeruleilacunae TaxID=2499076 RepID=A0ABX1WSJ7_9BACT|nr:FKBP-type peptidyl-prolyl cis-trans isomerase [Marinifilum caeruleilacunae]NOU59084.1 FKBP-type peptidyl-prolyl cis-trans isomerase [Marinifilum caeruleilacunae]